MKIEQADEMIKTLSGQLYPLTAVDIENFVAKLSRNLAQCIKSNSVIGLFLPLGSLSLLPLLIYRACIECGATVLRFGNTQIERQLWLLRSFDVDYIISSPAIWRLIESNHESVSEYEWFAYLTLGEEQKRFDENELKYAKRTFIELYNVPAFLIQDEDKCYECPYHSFEILSKSNVKVKNGDRGQLVIATNNIEGYSFDSFYTGINAAATEDEQRFFIDLSTEHSEIDYDMLHSRIKKIIQRHNLKFSKDDKQLNIDSLGMVELLISLEEEFSFSVSVEEINRADFLNYESIFRFVTGRIDETNYRGEVR